MSSYNISLKVMFSCWLIMDSNIIYLLIQDKLYSDTISLQRIWVLGNISRTSIDWKSRFIRVGLKNIYIGELISVGYTSINFWSCLLSLGRLWYGSLYMLDLCFEYLHLPLSKAFTKLVIEKAENIVLWMYKGYNKMRIFIYFNKG